MTRRQFANPADQLYRIKQAVETAKRVFNTPDFVKVTFRKVAGEYKNATILLQAFKKLNILEESKAESGKFKWALGIHPIDDKLINAIYDEVKAIQAAEKRNRGTQPSRKNGRDKGNFNNQSKPQTPAQEPEAKSKIKEPFVPKEKSIKGTIFGYKQLAYMKRLFFYDQKVMKFDNGLEVSDVNVVTFQFEEGKPSRLNLLFYRQGVLSREAEETSTLIAKIALDNQVIAMHDSEDGVISLTRIPVKNPYKIEML